MIGTALTKLCGITHPLILAPMAGVAGARLAHAVSAAGGLGLIGGGYGDRGWLRGQLAEQDCADIGVGFISWRLHEQPALLDEALEFAPKAIFLSFGEVDEFAARIKAANTLFIAQVQSLEAARAAAAVGADVIVAQGTEAGGHGAARATLPLVPAVVDAVDPIPVVAAGGIADGRGLAAALMLGASGVVMGTRFYCSEESLAPAAAKKRALASGGDDTIRTAVFDVLREYDWPRPYNLRTVTNAMTARYGEQLNDLYQDKAAQIARFEQAIESADFDIAAVIAGEALDLVDDVPPAATIVNRTLEQAVASLRHPRHFSLEKGL